MKRHHWLMAVMAAAFGAVAFFWTQGAFRAPARAPESPTPIADSTTPASEAAPAGSQARPGPVAPPSGSPSSLHDVEPTVQDKASTAPRGKAAQTEPHPATKDERSPEELNAAIAALFEEMVTDDHKHAFQSQAISAHATVQAEEIDPQWGPTANQQIESFFKAEFGDRYDMPMIDCRTNICEVRAVGKPSGDMDADTVDWQRAVGRMQSQPWWSSVGFDEQSVLVTSVPNGPPMFILFITRK